MRNISKTLDTLAFFTATAVSARYINPDEARLLLSMKADDALLVTPGVTAMGTQVVEDADGVSIVRCMVLSVHQLEFRGYENWNVTARLLSDSSAQGACRTGLTLIHGSAFVPKRTVYSVLDMPLKKK